MSKPDPLLPALGLQVQLAALASLGLDVGRVRSRVGEIPKGPDALVPRQAYLDMWEEALVLYGRPGLPTALAMAVPFGAFGALDYLVGSADTVAGACQSAQQHFAMVASDVWLDHEELDDGHHIVRVRADQGTPSAALEFTLGSLVHRLRHLAGDAVMPVRVALPVPDPGDDPVRERLYGDALGYDHPCAELTLDAAAWRCKISRADPLLHATLMRVAAQLHIVPAGVSPLVSALRARLRNALSQGRPDPARLAALLGVSERTLQRRLAGEGQSFSSVLDEFRREEAARLLRDDQLQLVQVAGLLGYTEQTSFTRAFRRWTGTTPRAWRER